MIMIHICDEKDERLSETCEKMLHYSGKIMQCMESIAKDGKMSHHDDSVTL